MENKRELLAKQKLLIIKKELFRRQAIDSFEKFLLYINPEFWSVRLQIKEFKKAVKDAELLANGYIDFLMISLPAGFGKSYLRECWNGWVVGRDLNNTVLIGTYSDSIAKTFTRYFERIITDERYMEIFGQHKFEVKTQNEIRLKGTMLPFTYFSRGAGASVTGNRAKFIQVDDIIKDFEESQSPLIKQKRWDWYTTTLKTRKAENTLKEFWCGTRWAKDDPMGRKLEELNSQMELGLLKPYKVKIHAIPAMITKDVKAKDGSNQKDDVSICEDWTTTEELKKIKSELTSRPEVWEALYQQNPIDSIGALFPETQLKLFNSNEVLLKDKRQFGEAGVMLNNPEKYSVFSIADVADTGKDYHAVGFFAYNMEDKTFKFIDAIFTQEGVETTAPEHANLIVKHNSVFNRVEKNNFGKFYAKEVETQIRGRSRAIINKVTTKMNKEQKIYLWAGFVMETIEFRDDWKILPESHPYKMIVRNITEYDRSGKNKHDDGADMIAMAGQTISKQFNVINATLKAFNKATQSKHKDIER